MALWNWSPEYSVEEDSLDRQHQELFRMLNDLHDAMKEGTGAQAAPGILKNLVQYVLEHFACEEALMAQAGYPDLARHKAEHDKLTDELAQILQDFESGKVALSMKLLQFLRTWLQDHILGCDKKYAPFL
jgi:hemerythrin